MTIDFYPEQSYFMEVISKVIQKEIKKSASMRFKR